MSGGIGTVRRDAWSGHERLARERGSGAGPAHTTCCLMLVDAMAERWGWNLPPSGQGKIVWAVLRT